MTEGERLLWWMLDRIEGTCLIETDGKGVVTRFGPGAEAFFGCPAAEAVGLLRYSAFHDASEMERCKGDAEFKRSMETPGWNEAEWRVIPRSGEPFAARVTLAPLRGLDNGAGNAENPPRGWLALYRKL